MLGVALVGVAALWWVKQQSDADVRAYAEQMAAERAVAERQAAAHRQEWSGLTAAGQLSFCRQHWFVDLNIGWEPQALAWSEGRLDGYFQASVSPASLQHLSCANGDWALKERYEHPFAAQLNALAESSASPDDSLYDRMFEILQSLPAAHPPSAVELIRYPGEASVIVRRRYADAPEQVLPADAPDFAALAPGLAPTAEATHPRLVPRPRFQWNRDVPAVFALLHRELPPDFRIVEASFNATDIDLEVQGPLADLPAPRGSISFDEWGERQTWLYPREAIGFGCAQGLSLAALESRFREDAERKGYPLRSGVTYSIASYSCSGGRREGSWTLHLQH